MTERPVCTGCSQIPIRFWLLRRIPVETPADAPCVDAANAERIVAFVMVLVADTQFEAVLSERSAVMPAKAPPEFLIIREGPHIIGIRVCAFTKYAARGDLNVTFLSHVPA